MKNVLTIYKVMNFLDILGRVFIVEAQCSAGGGWVMNITIIIPEWLIIALGLLLLIWLPITATRDYYMIKLKLIELKKLQSDE